jgi:hypothetical protein
MSSSYPEETDTTGTVYSLKVTVPSLRLELIASVRRRVEMVLRLCSDMA